MKQTNDHDFICSLFRLPPVTDKLENSIFDSRFFVKILRKGGNFFASVSSKRLESRNEEKHSKSIQKIFTVQLTLYYLKQYT